MDSKRQCIVAIQEQALLCTLGNQLTSEFNLRIIRTYGAAGNGKGAIDGMSSFGVKNVLRKDIVTHNVFFNKSEEVVDYL